MASENLIKAIIERLEMMDERNLRMVFQFVLGLTRKEG